MVKKLLGGLVLRSTFFFLAFIYTSVFGLITDHSFRQHSLSVKVVSKSDDLGPVVLETDLGELYIFPQNHERQALWDLLRNWNLKDQFRGWQTQSEPSTLIAIENLNTGSMVFAYTIDTPPPSKQKPVQLIGERCSGTNFCERIFSKHLSTDFKWRYGWKHFPRWFYKNDKWQKDTETLFIVIFRNPYDWLRSFYLKPHHACPSLKQRNGASFFKFISSEWFSLMKMSDPPKKIDLNPEDNSPFENVLKMRSAKVRNFLELKKAPNHFFLRYEDLSKAPFLYIMKLAQLFHLRINAIYSPIEKHLGSGTEMPKVQEYFSISAQEKWFIDSELDWGLEGEIGYSSTDYR